MSQVRLKVCCIASVDEAQLATVCGATDLGLVSAMPSGPGVIDEPTIAGIAAGIGAPIESWLLTSLTQPDAIARQHARCRTSTIQFVDAMGTLEDYARVRARLPGVRLVQVIHVTDERAIDQARAVAPFVDRLLLDSGNPAIAVKELGGTGRTHNWEISRAIVDAVAVPVFLAGGLRPDNVADAIRTVRPFGIDVCSGVRTNGALDATRLAAFVTAAGV